MGVSPELWALIHLSSPKKMGHRCCYKPSTVKCRVHSPAFPTLWGEREHRSLTEQSRNNKTLAESHVLSGRSQIHSSGMGRGEGAEVGVEGGGGDGLGAPAGGSVSFPHGHSKDNPPHSPYNCLLTNGQPGDRGTPPSKVINPGGQEDTSLQPV